MSESNSGANRQVEQPSSSPAVAVNEVPTSYRPWLLLPIVTLILDATRRLCEDYLYQHSEWGRDFTTTARQLRNSVALGWPHPDEAVSASASRGQTEIQMNQWKHRQSAREVAKCFKLDCEDYLRWNHWLCWPESSDDGAPLRTILNHNQATSTSGDSIPEFTAMSDEQRWQLFAPWLGHLMPGTRANALIVLLTHAIRLMDEQPLNCTVRACHDSSQPIPSATVSASRLPIQSTTKIESWSQPSFGTARGSHYESVQSSQLTPYCPDCGGRMVLRVAKQGQHVGRQFWGCVGYPECRGVTDIDSV